MFNDKDFIVSAIIVGAAYGVFVVAAWEGVKWLFSL
jgi:hypothetical protein